MANQIIIFGMIEGASLGGKSRHVLQQRNAEVIAQLPAEDEFPWLTRGMFALPGPSPQGTFREQIIHFGLSMKDSFLSLNAVYDPERGWPAEERAQIIGWIGKFESLLRRLYWYGAELHIRTEVEPDRLFCYTPTESAIGSLFQDEPGPIADWHLEVVHLPEIRLPR